MKGKGFWHEVGRHKQAYLFVIEVTRVRGIDGQHANRLVAGAQGKCRNRAIAAFFGFEMNRHPRRGVIQVGPDNRTPFLQRRHRRSPRSRAVQRKPHTANEPTLITRDRDRLQFTCVAVNNPHPREFVAARLDQNPADLLTEPCCVALAQEGLIRLAENRV